MPALAPDRRLAFDLLVDGGQVGIVRFLEQRTLFTNERLAGLVETYSPVVGKLVCQRGDCELLLGQQGTALRQFGLLLLN